MPIDAKRIVARTFSEMVAERGLDRVSVKALIERCGVSRQTFYYHFRDLNDLITWQIGQRLDDLFARSRGAECMEDAFRMLIEEVVSDRVTFRRILMSTRRSEIEGLLVSGLRGYFERMAREKIPAGAVDLSSLDTALSLYAHGVTGILLERCLDPQVDADLLARQLARVVSGAPLAP